MRGKGGNVVFEHVLEVWDDEADEAKTYHLEVEGDYIHIPPKLSGPPDSCDPGYQEVNITRATDLDADRDFTRAELDLHDDALVHALLDFEGIL